jgi:hypothetical protein
MCLERIISLHQVRFGQMWISHRLSVFLAATNVDVETPVMLSASTNLDMAWYDVLAIVFSRECVQSFCRCQMRVWS